MKKTIFLLFFALATHLAMAQRTVYHHQPGKLFNRGKEMFLERNYTGAQDLLSQFITESTDRLLTEEAKYMMAVSSFHKGVKNSGERMKEYLDEYPESIHHHQVKFLIGSYHFNEKDWKLARFWFDQADLDYLKPSEQEDFSFRSAYANLQLGNKDEAYRLFGLLSQNSKKYRDYGSFYAGYIDYTNGNYDAALRRFEGLRNHPEFGEQVAFYSAQSTFFDNKLDEAIRLAESFLSVYPHSEHITEIYRVLGNSHYRQGRAATAIPYYENYFAGTVRPLRGDAYFMGLSYVEARKFHEAVQMFQKAVGERDVLTQNAQLQIGQTQLKLGQKQQAQMAFEAASRDNFDPQVRETAMFNYALLAHDAFRKFSQRVSNFSIHRSGERYPCRNFPNHQGLPCCPCSYQPHIQAWSPNFRGKANGAFPVGSTGVCQRRHEHCRSTFQQQHCNGNLRCQGPEQCLLLAWGNLLSHRQLPERSVRLSGFHTKCIAGR